MISLSHLRCWVWVTMHVSGATESTHYWGLLRCRRCTCHRRPDLASQNSEWIHIHEVLVHLAWLDPGSHQEIVAGRWKSTSYLCSHSSEYVTALHYQNRAPWRGLQLQKDLHVQTDDSSLSDSCSWLISSGVFDSKEKGWDLTLPTRFNSFLIFQRNVA